MSEIGRSCARVVHYGRFCDNPSSANWLNPHDHDRGVARLQCARLLSRDAHEHRTRSYCDAVRHPPFARELGGAWLCHRERNSYYHSGFSSASLRHSQDHVNRMPVCACRVVARLLRNFIPTDRGGSLDPSGNHRPFLPCGQ